MSNKKVIVDLTRVEGEGRIIIDLSSEDPEVMLVGPDYRAIEYVMRNQPLYRIPLIASRICGICYISHYVASLKETHILAGTVLPPGSLATLEFANMLQHIIDNILHVFVMCSNDLSSLTKRSEEIEVLRRRGMRVFVDLMAIIRKAFGSPVHPMLGVVGLVPKIDDILEKIRDQLSKAVAGVKELLGEGEEIVMEAVGRSSEYPGSKGWQYLALTPKGCYELSEGNIMVANEKGEKKEITADELIAQRKILRYGYIVPPLDGEPYRTGPLARCVLKSLVSLSDIHKNDNSPLLYHMARYIETKRLIEKIEAILSEKQPLQESEAGLTHGVEAPRGTLIHRYTAQSDGKINVAVLTPTAINTPAIERDIRSAIVARGTRNEHEIKLIAEIVARAYNPCFSCAACIVNINK